MSKSIKFRLRRIYRRNKTRFRLCLRLTKKRFISSLRWTAHKWLWLLTAIFIVIAAYTYLYTDGIEQAALTGDFLAGFAGALAFLWLIASFRLQSHELSLQRKELELQRQALEQQTKELGTSAKFAALSQISKVIGDAEDFIQKSELEVEKADQLAPEFLTRMVLWTEITESIDAMVVWENFRQWSLYEAASRSYLSSIVTASKIYIEYYLGMRFDGTKSNEEFFMIYSSLLNDAPYISQHVGSGFLIANFLVRYEPGLKSVQLAGLTAQTKVIGKNVLKEGVLEELTQYFVSRDIELPAIVGAK